MVRFLFCLVAGVVRYLLLCPLILLTFYACSCGLKQDLPSIVSKTPSVLKRSKEKIEVVAGDTHNALSPEVVSIFNDPVRSALYVVDSIGNLFKWSLKEQPNEATLLAKLGVIPRKAAYNSTKDWFAVAFEREVVLFSRDPLIRLHRFGPFPFPVTSLDFDPNGTSLVAGLGDGKILRWRSLDKTPFAERYIGPNSVIGAVRFHPSGKLFFSGDWAGSLNAWTVYESDLQQGAYDQNILASGPFTDFAQRASAGKIADSGIDSISVSKDGEWLAVGSSSGKLILWKIRGFRKAGDIAAHAGAIKDVAINDDGSLVATIGRDEVVRFWKVLKKGLDPVTLTPLYEIVHLQEANVPGVRAITIEQNRTFVGSRDGTLAEVIVNNKP